MNTESINLEYIENDWKSFDEYEESLIIRRKELLSQIEPSESGILIPEYTKCGKKNCKCSSGILHGPYYYHYFWDNGKLRKKYICTAHTPTQEYFDLLHKITKKRENKNIMKKVKEIDSLLIKITKLKSKINELIENKED